MEVCMPQGPTAHVTRVAHDVGLAAWVGGSLFGRLAFNRGVTNISDTAERGKVTNATYAAYNPVNALGLGAAASGWLAARATETRGGKLTGTEHALSTAKDALMSVAVLSGVATVIQHIRLARQGEDGRVPLEAPLTPAPETPPAAAKLQGSINKLTSVNILSGLAIVAVNAVIAQFDHSRPPLRRALFRRGS